MLGVSGPKTGVGVLVPPSLSNTKLYGTNKPVLGFLFTWQTMNTRGAAEVTAEALNPEHRSQHGRSRRQHTLTAPSSDARPVPGGPRWPVAGG